VTRRNAVIIAIIAILLTVVLIKVFKKDVWDVNEELMKQEVMNIGSSIESVNLSDVTPFEWDLVYSFNPYTPKETIYKTVGYKWDSISETLSESMNQLVFMKDGKVVCYLYGYPENNGYGIYFRDGNDTSSTQASVLSPEDDLTFQVVKRENIIYLMKKE